MEAITGKEEEIIEQIRKIEWGKVEVVVKDGKPVMVSIKKDIKLDIPE